MSFYGILKEDGDKPKQQVIETEVKQELEFINEFRIYSGKELLITVDGDGYQDRGYANDPYFKVYDNIKREAATKICRIAIKESKYIKPHITSGLDSTWKLNSSERKNLDNILSNNEIWVDLLEKANKLIQTETDKFGEIKYDLLPLNLKKPDYTNIRG